MTAPASPRDPRFLTRLPASPRARREQLAELRAAAAFMVTGLSGLLLFVAIWLDWGTPAQGILAFLALGGLGAGLVIWAHELLPTRLAVEERHPLTSDPGQLGLTRDAFLEETGFRQRRRLLGAMLMGIGGLSVAGLAPLLSLGPLPSSKLFHTSWRKGLRVVGENGKPVKSSDIAVGGILTVFPEGHVGDAMAQTVLINVGPGKLQKPTNLGWAPDGYVAYSKVCTHAGCPVGLFRAGIYPKPQDDLICPCHQSTFDVLRGAEPVFGPAGRALPQLPIRLQPDGTFVALGDFPEPVGPAFWNMTD